MRRPLLALGVLCAALGLLATPAASAGTAPVAATPATPTVPAPSATVGVGGAIGEHHRMLGGADGFLGRPLTGEIRTPNGRGAYVVFEGGSVYWSPATGAQEVHGAIREHWGRLGWENGPLGFPTSIEYSTMRSGGAYSAFQGGSLHWSPATGAHLVKGAIRDAWGRSGWETGPLGFPTSDEYDVPGGKRSDFQHGHITWTPRAGAVVSAPSAVAGCTTRPVGTTPEHAVHCTLRAWVAGRPDLVRAHTGRAAASILLDPTLSRMRAGVVSAEGCAAAEPSEAAPLVATSIGVVCTVRLSHPVTAPAEEGGWLYLGMGRDTRGVHVENIVTGG
ncbi:LGFP repeat-containing protein [Kineococcus xinjiangensis]|uniref:LGFP repeat-containing protein n=1 Tax=Kineococcus xinjiangensis TaxID=512762 RepID=A0A2S6IGY4_9ACTN|nr:hypothetical protein [Kineococcus xinjiangensis]PPK93457.1 LGFP repeat-containing protein [Kineococcus xinjiangensis]